MGVPRATAPRPPLSEADREELRLIRKDYRCDEGEAIRLLANRKTLRRTREERDALAIPVLVGAFELIRRGWVRPASPLLWGDVRQPTSLHTLGQALNMSRADPDRMADVEYALDVLNRVEGCFERWEEHPLRTQRDVLYLLERAILHVGGEVPGAHRGGWRVGRAG